MRFFYVLLCFYYLQISPIFAHFFEICSPKNKFSVKNGQEIYNIDIKINYNIDHIHVQELPVKSLELLTSNATVLSSGYIKSHLNEKQPFQLNFTLSPSKVINVDKEVNGRNESQCELIFSDTSISSKLFGEIQPLLIELAQECYRSRLCNQLSPKIPNEPVERVRNSSGNKQRSCVEKSTVTSQETINAMADFVLSIIQKKVLGDSGKFTIPKIQSEFSTDIAFWTASGNLKTSDGEFQGLKNLKRKSDILLEHNKTQFSLKTIYALSESKVTFSHYEVAVSKLNVDGILEVGVRDIILTVEIDLDFNSPVCKIRLNEFKADNGKFDVELTGLGILNSPVSKLVAWIIETKLYTHAKSIVTDLINTIDCEQFRP